MVAQGHLAQFCNVMRSANVLGEKNNITNWALMFCTSFAMLSAARRGLESFRNSWLAEDCSIAGSAGADQRSH